MLEIYFDGACEPINPGGTASCGFLIKKNGRIVAQESKIIGSGNGMTNNLAEYQGLVSALKYLVTHPSKSDSSLEVRLVPRSPEDEVGRTKWGGRSGADSLTIFTDSSLVYNMVAKNWGWSKKKTIWKPHKDHPHLKKLLFEALELLEKFQYKIKWIPREQNQAADDLSKNPLIKAGIKII